MKKFSYSAALIIASLSLSSCSTIQNLINPKKVAPIDYLEGGVKMDVKKFFDGDIDAFAIKQDSTGKIVGSITAEINGRWKDNKGVIQQDFTYNDGKKDSRTWLITANQDGTFSAVGHDVTNSAKGKQVGNAAQSIYSLMLDSKTAQEEFTFEERMYLVNEESMIMIINFDKKKSEPNSSGKIIFSLKKIPEQTE